MIYRIDPDTGVVQSYPTHGPVGCVVVEPNGTLLSAEKGGIYRINPKTGERAFLMQPEDDPAMRYNDGKLDPKGRFLVGTKGDVDEMPGAGRLFSIDGEQVRTLVSGTSISNGIGFSKTGNFLYFIDSPTKKVGRYLYQLDTGVATFDRYVVDITGGAWPDGMCVDGDDMLWVAEWGGGRVCRWDSETGKKVREIKFPCTNVSSCCLGGKNAEFLFVTTAKAEGRDEALGGGLFRIRL